MHTVWACLATDRRPVQGLSLLLSYDSCNMLHTHPPNPTLTCRSGGKWMDGMKIWTNSVSMNCIFTIIKTAFYWAFTFLLDKINNIQSKAKQNEHETAEVIWCEYLFPLKPLKLMLALKQLWWYEKEKSLFCAKKNILVSSQFKERVPRV